MKIGSSGDKEVQPEIHFIFFIVIQLRDSKERNMQLYLLSSFVSGMLL